MESGAESWTKCARKLIETSRNARSPVAPLSLVPALSCCLELTFSLDAICRQRGLARPAWGSFKGKYRPAGHERVQSCARCMCSHPDTRKQKSIWSKKLAGMRRARTKAWFLTSWAGRWAEACHKSRFVDLGFASKSIIYFGQKCLNFSGRYRQNLPALLHIAKLGTVSYFVPYLSVWGFFPPLECPYDDSLPKNTSLRFPLYWLRLNEIFYDAHICVETSGETVTTSLHTILCNSATLCSFWSMCVCWFDPRFS